MEMYEILEKTKKKELEWVYTNNKSLFFNYKNYYEHNFICKPSEDFEVVFDLELFKLNGLERRFGRRYYIPGDEEEKRELLYNIIENGYKTVSKFDNKNTEGIDNLVEFLLSIDENNIIKGDLNYGRI